jgi:hypothetical protein
VSAPSIESAFEASPSSLSIAGFEIRIAGFSRGSTELAEVRGYAAWIPASAGGAQNQFKNHRHASPARVLRKKTAFAERPSATNLLFNSVKQQKCQKRGGANRVCLRAKQGLSHVATVVYGRTLFHVFACVSRDRLLVA